MIPGDGADSVDPPALLTAVADFVAATSWSGQTRTYTVPTTYTAADDVLVRVADVVSKLPARYSFAFGIIADHALQGAVDTMYADQLGTEGETS